MAYLGNQPVDTLGISSINIADGSIQSVDIADGAVTRSKLSSDALSVAWQSVQTTGFTAIAGMAYPCNTTSTAFIVTLPASPVAGNVIILTDYAGTWATNNLTVNPNGLKINGVVSNTLLSTNRGSVQLVYVDATQGWAAYSGFAVTTLPINYNIEIFVLGGGGGGTSGGGGSGGISYNSALTITPGTSYTATVGSGGASATNGVDSTFSGSGITTVRGYGGGTGGSGTAGANGGSGGGANSNGPETTLRLGGTATQGAGGTTYYGSAGGSNSSLARGQGGGGGTGAVGQDAQVISGSFNGGANGGNGTSAFSAWLTVIDQGVDSSGTRYIGGGGGGANSGTTSTVRTGGLGGGGDSPASYNANASPGLANTGGGGGGGWNGTPGSGGSGIICIRYAGTQRGTGGTIVYSGGYTYHTFIGNGIYTG